MKILVINGPNMNLLGIREPEIYGNKTYKDLCAYIKTKASKYKYKVKFYQSNIEGKIVDKIQQSVGKYDYIILNAAAYSHTSVAIHDAIKATNAKVIEVHMTDTSERETYRQVDLVEEVSIITFKGKGFDSYIEALDYISKNSTLQ